MRNTFGVNIVPDYMRLDFDKSAAANQFAVDNSVAWNKFSKIQKCNYFLQKSITLKHSCEIYQAYNLSRIFIGVFADSAEKQPTRAIYPLPGKLPTTTLWLLRKSFLKICDGILNAMRLNIALDYLL